MVLRQCGVLLILALAACSPSSPSGEGPQITCPPSLVADSLNGAPVVVTYPAPTVSGGTAPVTVTCTHPSGSAFPLGTTNVTCTARDQANRTSACTFAVTVSVPPRMSVTKFMAFGDSITYGTVIGCPGRVSGARSTSILRDIEALRRAGNPETAYPNVLNTMLSSRYRTQFVTVANEGEPGEAVTDSSTAARFQSVFNANLPEVVLLQEGVNDLHGFVSPSSVASALASLVRAAKGRGAHVLLGTLLPQRIDGCAAYDAQGLRNIEPTNNLIRQVAFAEGAVLVDLYAAFAGQEAVLLGDDGLHPTPAGYVEMAETFFDVIRGVFEVP